MENRVIKFRAWCEKDKSMYFADGNYEFRIDGNGVISFETRRGEDDMRYYSTDSIDDENGYKIEVSESTGLFDKNGVEGYFDSDIWEVKDYEYSEPHGGGYYTRKCDLRFILRKGLLSIDYELISPPKELKSISLNVIFNLPSKSGGRTFTDTYRQSLEIIGTVFTTPELLNGK